MTKRDDDSQADMEVGMTTAERRRRRRRGGGLRVPSDNVPRRTSTPPVVAPVPEDPALAMSIAYSFASASESSEPISRTSREVPSFENHEGMPTVIDPVSGPVEQADFEMKTREMTAVDLEELGLSEVGMAGTTMPFQRISSPGIEPTITMPLEPPGLAIRFTKREATEPADEADEEDVEDVEDVEVDLDTSLEGVVDGGATLDQEPGRGFDLVESEVELDAAETTTIHPGPPLPPKELAARATESSAPRSVITETSRPVAMPAMPAATGDGPPPRPIASDGSQPRSAVPPAIPTAPATTGDGPPPRPIASESSQPRPAMPPAVPTAPATMSEGPPPRPIASESSQPRPATPGTGDGPPPRPAVPGTSDGPSPRPAIGSPPGYRTGRAQTVALSEDDLEEVREAARLATQPPTPPTPPPPRPASISIPPPMPSAKPPDVKRAGEPASPPLVPEIDLTAFDDKVAESTGEFEVDVDGIVESRIDEPDRMSAVPPIPPSVVEARVRTIAPAPTPPVPSTGPPAPPLLPHATSMPPPSPGHPTAMPPPSPGHPASIQPPGPGHPTSMAPPGSLRESQPMTVARDGHGPPPPPPAIHRAPPSPPPSTKREKSSPGLPSALAPPIATPLGRSEVREPKADGKPPRTKPWFIELFDEDYLRTLPFLTPQATQAEAEFVINAMGLTPGAQVLDVGCGYGRHAMELAARGFHVVGLDLSTPLLVRGGEEAHRRGLTINFVRGDMRELDFDAQFDGAYCLFSTFGYFDDETNKKTVANFARALRPGGRVLIEILNRDYVISDLPTRVWWEGDGCVVLEEVELNYFSSRIQVNRSVVFDDGRQLEQDISVRAYSLHEVGKLLHSAGLRVLEVSGAYHTRGRFFGNQSRHIIVLAERKDPGTT